MSNKDSLYEAEIRLKLAQAKREIDALTSISASTAAAAALDALERLVAQFELEGADDPAHAQKIRGFKKQGRQLRKTLNERIAGLDLDRPAADRDAANETAGFLENEQLEHAKRKLYESQGLTINIASELERNRNSLMRSLQSSLAAGAELGVSAQLVGAIGRIRKRQGVFARVVLVAVALMLLYLVYRVVFRR